MTTKPSDWIHDYTLRTGSNTGKAIIAYLDEQHADGQGLGPFTMEAMQPVCGHGFTNEQQCRFGCTAFTSAAPVAAPPAQPVAAEPACGQHCLSNTDMVLTCAKERGHSGYCRYELIITEAQLDAALAPGQALTRELELAKLPPPFTSNSVTLRADCPAPGCWFHAGHPGRHSTDESEPPVQPSDLDIARREVKDLECELNSKQIHFADLSMALERLKVEHAQLNKEHDATLARVAEMKEAAEFVDGLLLDARQERGQERQRAAQLEAELAQWLLVKDEPVVIGRLAVIQAAQDRARERE